jgi:hypothetical protein
MFDYFLIFWVDNIRASAVETSQTETVARLLVRCNELYYSVA